MKSQQQARARASARRKGWLGIAAATALLATSMGGTMLAFAADGQQSDIQSDAVLTSARTDEGVTPKTETVPDGDPADPDTDNSGTNQQPPESPGDTGDPENQNNNTQQQITPPEENNGEDDWNDVDDGMMLLNDDDEGIAAQALTCAPSGNNTCLRVNKTVINTGGGTAVASDFTFTVTRERRQGNNGAWSQDNGWSAAVSSGDSIQAPRQGTTGTGWNTTTYNYRYTVTENPGPANYEQTNASSQCTQHTPANGGTSSCTITNTYKAPPGPLSCEAGSIYAISASGQLQHVDSSSGAVTDIGTNAGQTFMNGLGIGSDGEPVYAIKRSSGSGTSQNAEVWIFDTATGKWEGTGASTTALGGNTGTNMVGGAVNLKNDLFYFGGFTSNGNFKVYEYNPDATPKIKLKATVTTNLTSSSNGDIAFDANGNLFIVSGSGTGNNGTARIFSVSADVFDAANGGTVGSSSTESLNTGSMTGVNGVAFDSSGKGFLGNGSTLRSYDQPNWNQNPSGNITTSMSSTDLASCSSPPTIEIKKEIIGGRLSPGDQFKLELKQGQTVIANTTTDGPAYGIQTKQIGPIPTVRGATLSFSEVGAGTTVLNNYASAYQCTLSYTDGTPTQTLDEVKGTSGTIKIPTYGDAVSCVFRNAPLVADVTIIKHVTDALGENPKPVTGWTVGAAATTTGAGTVTPSPGSATQQTAGTTGSANWKFQFNDKNGTASLKVSETMQPGYAFETASCEITRLNGNKSTQTLTSAGATAIENGIAPGDSVVCTYVNKPEPGELAITKDFGEEVPGDPWTGEDVTFSGTYTCDLPAGTEVAAGTWTVDGKGGATLERTSGFEPNALPRDAICTATETAINGESLANSSEGLPNSSWIWDTPSVSENVTIASGTTEKITVTNKAERVYGNFSIAKAIDGDGVQEGATFDGTWSCTLDDETVTGSWGQIAGGGVWTSTNNDGIPVGATCTATENQLSDDLLNSGYAWADGYPQYSPEGGVTAGTNAAEERITVTNKAVLIEGSVSWEKVDKANPPTHLGGSEWTIVGPQGPNSAELKVTDCVADSEEECAGPDVDHREGYFKVEGLVFGTYVLTETKAPEGYVVSASNPWTFTIDAEHVHLVLDPITNHKPTAPELPMTGGQAAAMFTAIGLLVLGGAGGAALIARRRRIS